MVPSIWNVLLAGFVPFRFHLKCQLLSEAFIYCSTKMDLLLFSPILDTALFFSDKCFLTLPTLSPTYSSPDFPISGKDPIQLLKPKTSVLLITLIWPHTHIQSNHSPNSSVSKIYPKCNHLPRSSLPPPYSRPFLLVWPDCTSSLLASALASLPFTPHDTR